MNLAMNATMLLLQPKGDLGEREYFQQTMHFGPISDFRAAAAQPRIKISNGLSFRSCDGVRNWPKVGQGIAFSTPVRNPQLLWVEKSNISLSSGRTMPNPALCHPTRCLEVELYGLLLFASKE